MGASVNSWALFVGLAAFAGWTLSRFTVSQNRDWINFLGGVGILALFFSIVSPDDDGFQQELIRPATPAVRVSAHTRVAQRRSPANFSISAVVETEIPILITAKARSFATDQPFELGTHFHTLISIHSPPLAS
ncbi:MAG: hypothetical protein C5B58_15295 [Acidobacteria bacterium]|nr:MAG: hypothetical protein C5B58_15295 [Acidobacteriota bacterium]